MSAVRRTNHAGRMAPTEAKTAAKLAPPIFVVGYMHSGTTLLLQILSGHSSIFAGRGETKYFDFLPRIRHDYRNLDDDEKLRKFLVFVSKVVWYGYNITDGSAKGNHKLNLDEEHLAALFAEARERREHAVLFRIVSDYLARFAGKERWLEKTPTHVLQIDQIVECVPNALFVEIVRDPRDVLASKKTRRLNVWETDRYTPAEKPLKHLEKSYDPVWDSLSWKSATRAALSAKAKYPGRVFSIRYEDLVAEPEVRVRELCKFLGLEFEPQMLQVRSRNSADRGESRGEGIASDAVGRWRRTLQPAEAALCQALVKLDLDRLGYEKPPITFAQRTRMPALIARSFFEFAQRLSRRWWLGGPAYSMNVLFNYWKRLRALVNS